MSIIFYYRILLTTAWPLKPVSISLKINQFRIFLCLFDCNLWPAHLFLHLSSELLPLVDNVTISLTSSSHYSRLISPLSYKHSTLTSNTQHWVKQKVRTHLRLSNYNHQVPLFFPPHIQNWLLPGHLQGSRRWPPGRCLGRSKGLSWRTSLWETPPSVPSVPGQRWEPVWLGDSLPLVVDSKLR